LKKEKLFYAALLAIAGIASYSNSFGCSFHFDDLPNIVSNQAITDLFNWNAWIFFNPYRPVGFFTFALNYHFNGLNVFGFHLVNLAIHISNAFLVWKLVSLLFRSPCLKSHILFASSGEIAFFTALIFVVHPLMTESVTYVVQRFVSLASMFCLLSLVLFIKGILAERKISRFAWYPGSAIAAMLGFLTKETAYSLPFLMIMISIFFFPGHTEINAENSGVNPEAGLYLGRRGKMMKGSSRFPGLFLLLLLLAVFSFFALASVTSGKYFSVIPPREGHPYFITPIQYYYTQINVLVTYLRLVIIPVNQTLDYNFPMVSNLAGFQVIINLAGLVFLLALSVWLYKKDRLVSFGILWFFICIAPQALVPRSNFIFEHRAYLSAIGIILIWVLLFYYLFGKINLLKYRGSFWGRNFLSLAACLLLIQGIGFARMTHERNKVWQNDYNLWSDCLQKAPGSARAMVNLGSEQIYRQEYSQAVKNFDKAITIFPLYLQAWSNRAMVRIILGDNEKAIEEMNFAISRGPGSNDAYVIRGIALRNLKRYKESIADFTFALSERPERSDTYFQRGLSFWMSGQNDAALKDIMQAASMKNQDAVSFLGKNMR
jgi:tetratricopeptide (TPR) repeat protein